MRVKLNIHVMYTSVLTVVSTVYVQWPLCSRAVQSSVGCCQLHGGQRVPSSVVSLPVTPGWPLLSNYPCHSVTPLCPHPNNIIAVTMDTLMILITGCPLDSGPPRSSPSYHLSAFTSFCVVHPHSSSPGLYLHNFYPLIVVEDDLVLNSHGSWRWF